MSEEANIGVRDVVEKQRKVGDVFGVLRCSSSDRIKNWAENIDLVAGQCWHSSNTEVLCQTHHAIAFLMADVLCSRAPNAVWVSVDVSLSLSELDQTCLLSLDFRQLLDRSSLLALDALAEQRLDEFRIWGVWRRVCQRVGHLDGLFKM